MKADRTSGLRVAAIEGAHADSASGRTAPEGGGVAPESGELHRLLVESVQDYAIFALDPQGYILSWNAGAQHLKGYTADEAIGQHFSIFYPADVIARRHPEQELEVAAREGHFEEEGWRVRKDGSRFWANVLISALRDDDGTLVGFAKVTRDLTERRAAQIKMLNDARQLASEEAARRSAEDRALESHALTERLREQAAELEQRRVEAENANKAKGSFLAAMSHELRTPLNAIGGYAELLEMGITGPVTPAQIEQIHRIRVSQQHLLRVINDILNFSRIEAARISYDITNVVMHEVTESVALMIDGQARRKGIVFEHTFCPPDLVARADRAKVQQVILNLLSNALKFTPANGSVTLTCRLLGGELLVDVEDTGAGIPVGKLEAVFEPFVQVERTLTSDHEGTGLGLAISRELARAMHGDVTVQSVLGVGSTFTLHLPLATDPEAAD
ncbi:hypothetical protein BH09GEM1_BH09GEM1_34460 [soil metagenome]